MYHGLGEKEDFWFRKKISQIQRSLNFVTGCFQTRWAIWVSCHIFLAIFRKTEKPVLPTFWGRGSTISTTAGLAPKVSGSSLGSNSANSSIPSNLYPNTRIFTVENLHPKCNPAPDPQFPRSPAIGGIRLSQQNYCALAQTITTVQIPTAAVFLPLSPPSPEIR